MRDMNANGYDGCMLCTSSEWSNVFKHQVDWSCCLMKNFILIGRWLPGDTGHGCNWCEWWLWPRHVAAMLAFIKMNKKNTRNSIALLRWFAYTVSIQLCLTVAQYWWNWCPWYAICLYTVPLNTIAIDLVDWNGGDRRIIHWVIPFLSFSRTK